MFINYSYQHYQKNKFTLNKNIIFNSSTTYLFIIK